MGKDFEGIGDVSLGVRKCYQKYLESRWRVANACVVRFNPCPLNKTLNMNHDITHCSGEGCPKRHKCYRYRAYVEMHIAEVVQVFNEPPYFEGECKFFIED